MYKGRRRAQTRLKAAHDEEEATEHYENTSSDRHTSRITAYYWNTASVAAMDTTRLYKEKQSEAV